MDIKRIFGAFLTLLGIGSLIYAVQIFFWYDVKTLVIYRILGMLFFCVRGRLRID